MNILITGGSSGLGKQLVKKLSVNYNVDFTYNKSIKSANELTDNLNKTKSFRVNFKKPGDLQNLINDTEGSYYDVLIHNFYDGKFLNRHFSMTSCEDFLNSMEVNIIPVITLSQNIIKKMKIKGKGLIIFISSESINSNPSGSFIYTSIKSVVENISKTINSENDKVKSIFIRPSIMKTKLTSEIDDRILNIMFKYDPDEMEKNVAEIFKIITTFKNQ